MFHTKFMPNTSVDRWEEVLGSMACGLPNNTPAHIREMD